MKKLHTDWLRETDPIKDDPGLTPAAAQEMRRAVMTAVQSTTPALAWSQAFAVGVAVAVTLFVGVLAGRQLPPPRNAAPAPPSDGKMEPRQFQFATPGGTRIIWVFDPEFSVKETIP